MELPRTPEGLVTQLAVVRAAQGVSLKCLARQVGATWEDVRDWEQGEASVPSGAMWRRLGMALGWRWCDLVEAPAEYDDAWQTLLHVRQAIAAAH